MSNWNASVTWEGKFNKNKNVEPNKKYKGIFWAGKTTETCWRTTAPCFLLDTDTQLIHVFDLCIITVKPLPPVNSTAKISPASSNPFKWWGISADLLYLGIKPAMQKQDGKKLSLVWFSSGRFSVEQWSYMWHSFKIKSIMVFAASILGSLL